MDDLILTVRARRLMKEIRRLRTATSLTVARAAKQLEIGEATLWRMENGKTRISTEVLVAMLDLYSVRSPQREALERLALDTLRRGWWAPYKDVFSGSYVALESDAAQIRVNAFMVPGFFQTPGYGRAAIAGTAPGLHLAEVERRMQARLARQKALFEDRDEPPTVHVLLDESVVRRQVGGPQAMGEQLARLAEIAEWPNVTIQVLPFSAGTHPGMDGEFVIIDFPDADDDPFVYEEGLFGDIYIETPEEIARYRLAFDHAAADAALTPADSLTAIRQLADRKPEETSK
ncbi:MAG TPA: helix-turn-helix transcriptional regulator [Streptosporangiaceae bacterium]|nr:helix-turn-helix transcriptional regulator [Streptosporangiaceae bacterium]